MGKWEMVRLGDVCELKSGKFMSASAIKDSHAEGLFPCYGGNGIRGYVDSFSHEGSYPLIGRQGALCGNVQYAHGRFYATEHAIVTRPKGELNTRWLCLILKAMNLNRYAVGAAQPGLTVEKLNNIPIPLPPLPAQQKIADILDRASALIEQRKAQIAKLDLLVKSQFVEMFGDPVVNTKNWPSMPLGELCKIYRGGSPRPIEQYLGGTVPWIKIGDATSGDDIYLHATKDHIIEGGIKKSRLVKAGSFIFANCGVSLGFARIITFDGCIHDGWLSFEDIDERLNKKFLLKSLNHCTDYFRATAPDGTQPNLNIGIMKSFQQILPPLDLQTQFAIFVERVEAQKTRMREGLGLMELGYKALMQKCFEGEFE